MRFARVAFLEYDFSMQKTWERPLTADETAEIKAAILKCDRALQRVFRQMRKDQAEIEELKRETRAILADLKTA